MKISTFLKNVDNWFFKHRKTSILIGTLVLLGLMLVMFDHYSQFPPF